MMNYLLISNDAEEVDLLARFLSQIPHTTVSSVSSVNQLCSTSIMDMQVAICNIELMDDNLLQTLTNLLPGAVVVAICNIAQMAIQHPAREIFGYLPSPITFERVLALTENIQTMLQHRTIIQTERKKDYVFIKSEYKLIKTNFSDILFIAGMKDYTQVYLKGKQSPLTTLQNLKEFETKLPTDEFIRVHRSYIVSLNQVDVIARNEIMMGTHHIPIGDSYRQALDLIIEKNS